MSVKQALFEAGYAIINNNHKKAGQILHDLLYDTPSGDDAGIREMFIKLHDETATNEEIEKYYNYFSSKQAELESIMKVYNEEAQA